MGAAWQASGAILLLFSSGIASPACSLGPSGPVLWPHDASSVSWSTSRILDDAAASASLPGVLSDCVQNARFCGNATGVRGGGCDLDYVWPLSTLHGAVGLGAVFGSVAVAHTGKVATSRGDLGVLDAAGRRPLAEVLTSGVREGFVYSVWHRGAASRASPYDVIAVGPRDVVDRQPGGIQGLAPFVRIGDSADGSPMQAGFTVNASPGFEIDPHSSEWLPYGMFLPRLIASGPKGSLAALNGNWQHVVVAAQPRSSLNASIVAWFNGKSGSFDCGDLDGTIISSNAPIGTEPGLPANASVFCQMTDVKALIHFKRTPTHLVPVNRSFLSAEFNIGSDTYFNRPGVPTENDVGGHTAVVTLHVSSVPITLASRVATAESVPAMALAAMPAVSNGTVACAVGPVTPATAGRVQCAVVCGRDAVPLVDASALCRSRERRGLVEVAPWLCDGGQDSEGFRGGMPALGVSWPSPVGWTGALGALGREGVSDELTPSSLARWTSSAPWDRILSPARRALPARQSWGVVAGAGMRCGDLPAATASRRRLGQSMVVQVCLGGLAVDPAFRDVSAALSMAAAERLALRLRTAAAQVLGLPQAEWWRVSLAGRGLSLSGDARELARLIGPSGAAPGPAAGPGWCANPARASVDAVFGSSAGNASDCICAHIGLSTRQRGWLAGDSVDRATASPAYLADALSLALRHSPAQSTALTLLSAVSPASVSAFPVFRCLTSGAREQAMAWAGGGAGARAVASAVLSALLSTGDGDSEPLRSLVPCHTSSAAAAWSAAAPWVAVAGVALVLVGMYARAHGSVFEFAEPMGLGVGVAQVLGATLLTHSASLDSVGQGGWAAPRRASDAGSRRGSADAVVAGTDDVLLGRAVSAGCVCAVGACAARAVLWPCFACRGPAGGGCCAPDEAGAGMAELGIPRRGRAPGRRPRRRLRPRGTVRVAPASSSDGSRSEIDLGGRSVSAMSSAESYAAERGLGVGELEAVVEEAETDDDASMSSHWEDEDEDDEAVAEAAPAAEFARPGSRTGSGAEALGARGPGLADGPPGQGLWGPEQAGAGLRPSAGVAAAAAAASSGGWLPPRPAAAPVVPTSPARSLRAARPWGSAVSESSAGHDGEAWEVGSTAAGHSSETRSDESRSDGGGATHAGAEGAWASSVSIDERVETGGPGVEVAAAGGSAAPAPPPAAARAPPSCAVPPRPHPAVADAVAGLVSVAVLCNQLMAGVTMTNAGLPGIGSAMLCLAIGPVAVRIALLGRGLCEGRYRCHPRVAAAAPRSLAAGTAVAGALLHSSGGALGAPCVRYRSAATSSFALGLLTAVTDLGHLRRLLASVTDRAVAPPVAPRLRPGTRAALSRLDLCLRGPFLLAFVAASAAAAVALNPAACLSLSEPSVQALQGGPAGCEPGSVCGSVGCVFVGEGLAGAGLTLVAGVVAALGSVWLGLGEAMLRR